MWNLLVRRKWNTSKPISEKDINNANSISILDYLYRNHLEPEKISHDSYKLHGYGGLIITPSRNIWNCFSEEKGGGPIQLVMFLENKSWLVAVKTLIGYKDCKIVKPRNQAKKKKGWILKPPPKYLDNNRVFEYLCGQRKIHLDIIKYCIHQGILYEDMKHNCVFLGLDRKNRIRHIHKKGSDIQNPYQEEQEDSDKSFAFSIIGSNNSVYAFEAPIDLISFISMRMLLGISWEHDHYISCQCTSRMHLRQYLIDHPNIKNIFMCFDNDEAGLKGMKKAEEEFSSSYQVFINPPPNKGQDFNDFLIDYLSKEKLNEPSECCEIC